MHTSASLPEFSPGDVVDLDLREDAHLESAWLHHMLAAVRAMNSTQVLHVRSRVRLDSMLPPLSQLGLACHSQAYAEDDWSTYVWREGVVRSPGRDTRSPEPDTSRPPDVVDLRHLPPPEPLLRLLEQLGRRTATFTVALPMLPPFLPALLAERRWRIRLMRQASDGVDLVLDPQGESSDERP